MNRNLPATAEAYKKITSKEKIHKQRRPVCCKGHKPLNQFQKPIAVKKVVASAMKHKQPVDTESESVWSPMPGFYTHVTQGGSVFLLESSFY